MGKGGRRRWDIVYAKVQARFMRTEMDLKSVQEVPKYEIGK